MVSKPDMLEYVIRFVCGAVVGGLLGALFVSPDAPASFYVGPGLGALAFGLLAVWGGDSFWQAFSRWFGMR